MLNNLQQIPPCNWETASAEEKQKAENIYKDYYDAAHGKAYRPEAAKQNIRMIKDMMKASNPQLTDEQLDAKCTAIQNNPNCCYVKDGKIIEVPNKQLVPAGVDIYFAVLDLDPNLATIHEKQKAQNLKSKTADRWLTMSQCMAANMDNILDNSGLEGEDLYTTLYCADNAAVGAQLNYSGSKLPQWADIGKIPQHCWEHLATCYNNSLIEQLEQKMSQMNRAPVNDDLLPGAVASGFDALHACAAQLNSTAAATTRAVSFYQQAPRTPPVTTVFQSSDIYVDEHGGCHFTF